MITCTKYTLLNKGTCVGIGNFYIEKWGLEIYGISLQYKSGKSWVNFPSRLADQNGEKKYYPYFRFKNPEHYKKFCEEIKLAIENYMKKEEVTNEQESF